MAEPEQCLTIRELTARFVAMDQDAYVVLSDNGVSLDIVDVDPGAPGSPFYSYVNEQHYAAIGQENHPVPVVYLVMRGEREAHERMLSAMQHVVDERQKNDSGKDDAGE
jgi:hypothetical protein